MDRNTTLAPSPSPEQKGEPQQVTPPPPTESNTNKVRKQQGHSRRGVARLLSWQSRSGSWYLFYCRGAAAYINALWVSRPGYEVFMVRRSSQESVALKGLQVEKMTNLDDLEQSVKIVIGTGYLKLIAPSQEAHERPIDVGSELTG
nr:hypothetical protein Iba_chr10fCG3620 [Ipomoea batatas]